MKLVNANPASRVLGLDEAAGQSHYFIGNDPGAWRTNVESYSRVKYESVYPGVDLVWHGAQRQLEYDFVLAPGARPERIKLAIEGADGVEIEREGALVLRVDGRSARMLKPVAWQQVDGERREIACQYRLDAQRRIAFDFGEYDSSKQLVIDPVLVYSTFIGGGGFDQSLGIAVDGEGAAYITGRTDSTDFPGPSQIQANKAAQTDAFVLKLNPAGADGSQLDYSTYLGGGRSDLAWAIAIDAANNAYVTGSTLSIDFPTVAAPQPKRGGDPEFLSTDAFVTKLSADGSSFAYSTYLGGGASDEGYGIAVDATGAAYVTGVAGSEDFPTTPGALRRTWARDSFITKVGISADLAISLSDLPDPVMVNNQLIYTLTVTNNGPDPAANVTVTDTLPSGVDFVSASSTQGACSGNGPVNCDLGALNAGGKATITITVRPTAAGNITNSASVTNTTADANAANNSATQETRVTTTPSIFGRVTTGDGAGTSAVTVRLTGAQRPDATTGSDGSYQFGELPTGANYTITPSRSGYVFNPPSRAFNNLTTDQRGDFAAVACVFTITPRTLSFPATGGSGSATIASPDPQCQWTVRSNSDWIRITSAASGSGAGVVTFTVAPTVGSRSGSVTIAGSALSVNQEFNACAKSDFLVPKTFALKEVSARYRTPRFAVKDFNSDGRLDLVFLTESSTGSGTGVAFAAGNSSGGFDQQAQVFSSPGGEFLGSLAVNDFNGDGRGGFRLSASLTINQKPKALLAADINSDGRDDVVFVSNCYSNEGLYAMLANNDGGFAPPVKYVVGPDAINPLSATLGDFNGDGKLDAAVANVNSGNVSILQGKGDGGFDAPILLPVAAITSYLAAADFNGDGAADLAVSRGESDSIAVLPNRASCAPPGAAVNASAASYFSYKLANESIAALFGANLASGTQVATSLPLPTTLANTSVKVKDGAGVERLSPLFFVSPNQINHLIPAGTAPGVALVTVMNGSSAVASGTTLITSTSPGLFAADASGQGLASAVALRVKADGSQVFEPIVRFDSAQNRFVAIPIDVSNASEQVFLLLFGAGIRNHGALAAVNAQIGGENAEVLFAGAQGGFAGLDQINLRLPRALAGRGDVEVRLTVNGKAANTARFSIE